MSIVLDMTINDIQRASLERSAARVADAKAVYDAAIAEREANIRRCAAEGATYREIGQAAGVSYQRVSQVVTGDKAPGLMYDAALEIECPTCGAKPGKPCKNSSRLFHGERTDKRMEMWLAEHPELA